MRNAHSSQFPHLSLPLRDLGGLIALYILYIFLNC